MAKIFYWLAPVYTTLIVYLSIGDNPSPAIKINNIDKIYHGGAYFMMALLWYFFFYSRFLQQQSHFNFTWKDILKSWYKPMGIAAAILSFIVGVLVEFAQEYISVNRTMDIYDGIANTTGIIFAILLLWLVSKRFNKH